MAIYMKFGGIQGDVTAAGHTNWIELNSLQWGVGRGVSSPTGGIADRESSAPNVSEVTVTKDNDTASDGLLTEAFTGDGGGNGASVQIDFTRTQAGQLVVFQTITLTNVIISGYSTSSGGDRPTESLSLNFTKIAVTNTPMKRRPFDGNARAVRAARRTRGTPAGMACVVQVENRSRRRTPPLVRSSPGTALTGASRNGCCNYLSVRRKLFRES
jgi:type VI secretion system secreted protein Hcp